MKFHVSTFLIALAVWSTSHQVLASNATLNTDFQRVVIPSMLEEVPSLENSEVEFALQHGMYPAHITSNGISFGSAQTLPSSDQVNRDKRSGRACFSIAFDGSNDVVQLVGEGRMKAVTHRFIGQDQSNWRQNIANFSRVRALNVYDHIDVVYQLKDNAVRYDLELDELADPESVQIVFEGVEEVNIGPQGDLLIEACGRQWTQSSPVIFEKNAKGTQPIAGRYVRKSNTMIAFELDSYTRDGTLVIDPTVEYASYLGSPAIDQVSNVQEVDGGEAIVISGWTDAATIQSMMSAGVLDTGRVNRQAFIAKLSTVTPELEFISYFDGTGLDEPTLLAVDTLGDIIIAGTTDSPDFPLVNPFDDTFQGGYSNGQFIFGQEPFVLKLSSGGDAVIYSSYLGGSTPRISTGNTTVFGFESARSLELDPTDNSILLVGETAATDFPTTHTLNGRSCMEDDVNEEGSTFTSDIFVTRIASDGQLVDSVCLGGSERDGGRGGTLDPSTGNVLVTGISRSLNIPITAGAFQPLLNDLVSDVFYDGYLVVLSADLENVVAASYFGGSGFDFQQDVKVNSKGQVISSGITFSTDFPTTPDSIQPFSGLTGQAPLGDLTLISDTYVLVTDIGLTTLHASTYLGGRKDDGAFTLELDAQDRIYLNSYTGSEDFPISSAVDDTKGNRLAGLSELSTPVTGVAESFAKWNVTEQVMQGSEDASIERSTFVIADSAGPNRVVEFLDIDNQVASEYVLDAHSADTRVIKRIKFGLNNEFLLVGNCLSPNRLYRRLPDNTFSFVDEFGDASFCTQHAVAVTTWSSQVNQLVWVIVLSDGENMRFYRRNPFSDEIFEDTSLPDFGLTEISAMVADPVRTSAFYVADRQGNDLQIVLPENSVAPTFVVPLPNGVKSTTTLFTTNSASSLATELVVGYDDEAFDVLTRNDAFDPFSTVLDVGLPDLVDLQAAIVGFDSDLGSFTVYAVETTLDGQTVLTCYCEAAPDLSHSYVPGNSVSLGTETFSDADSIDSLVVLNRDSGTIRQIEEDSADVAVSILSPDLTRLEFSSFAGGGATLTSAWGLHVPNSGEVWLSGRTQFSNLGAVNGDSFDNTFNGHGDGYVVKLNVRDILDLDADGIPDTQDNCFEVANDSQIDSDSDGFGNLCDADFNQDGITNFLDFVFLADNFLLPGFGVTDLNGDGVTNFLDIARFSELFLTEPGPGRLP